MSKINNLAAQRTLLTNVPLIHTSIRCHQSYSHLTCVSWLTGRGTWSHGTRHVAVRSAIFMHSARAHHLGSCTATLRTPAGRTS